MKDINWKAELIDFLKTLLVSFIIIFVITRFVARPVKVNQNSMYPTVLDQSVGITNIFSVSVLHDINRFDIVVIKMEDGKNLFKRVIGLPGETLSYVDDVLYIDGEPVDEPFINQEYKSEEINKLGLFTNDVKEITLANDEVYCLGDNRPFSKDSRDYGPFKESQITGKGIFIIYPFNRMGSVD
ncbi:signal peptidase I [Anaerorhabdus sp.]|jgi:signal peptidase I|uniref:signal peptidase I n=1 Tax=Anaerorhabdus sp. TaxID=1872524 RepID=UPI002FC63C12